MYIYTFSMLKIIVIFITRALIKGLPCLDSFTSPQ